MIAVTFIAGLTLLMLSCYFEWKTRQQPVTQPPIGKTAFKAVANLSALTWVGFSIPALVHFPWYFGLLAIITSIALPTTIVQRLIDKDMPGAVVYGSFMLGLILCTLALIMRS